MRSGVRGQTRSTPTAPADRRRASVVPNILLTQVAGSEDLLRGLVRRMAERINAEPEPRAEKLWTAND